MKFINKWKLNVLSFWNLQTLDPHGRNGTGLLPFLLLLHYPHVHNSSFVFSSNRLTISLVNLEKNKAPLDWFVSYKWLETTNSEYDDRHVIYCPGTGTHAQRNFGLVFLRFRWKTNSIYFWILVSGMQVSISRVHVSSFRYVHLSSRH